MFSRALGGLFVSVGIPEQNLFLQKLLNFTRDLYVKWGTFLEYKTELVLAGGFAPIIGEFLTNNFQTASLIKF